MLLNNHWYNLFLKLLSFITIKSYNIFLIRVDKFNVFINFFDIKLSIALLSIIVVLRRSSKLTIIFYMRMSFVFLFFFWIVILYFFNSFFIEMQICFLISLLMF